MKRLGKVAAVFSTAALSLGLMSGCAGGGSSESVDASAVKDGKIAGDITFQTWSLKTDKFTPYFENLIKEFEKKYPDVHVKWMDQPGDGYEDKLLQQANSDQLPDVVNVPPEYALSLAKAGKLLDLKAADEAAIKNYVAGGTKAYEFHGIDGTYAYPWYLGVSFNYWNKDALAAAGLDPANPPASEEEYLKAANQAADKHIALLNTVPGAGFFAAHGIKVFDEGKREFVFNTPDAVKMLEDYAAAYQKGAMPAELITKVDDGTPANEAFYKGTLGNIQSTPSFADNLKTDAPSLVDKVTVTEPWETPQLLVQGIAVSGQSKNAAAALAFAQFVTNNDNQVAFVKIAKGFMPGTVEGNKNPDFAAEDDTDLMKAALEVSAKTVQRAELLTPIEMNNEMKTAILQEVSAAMQGDKSAKDALDAAVKKCNEMMKDIDSDK
ncbi:MAG: extracellular solute-binding protein [Actinomycetaceae bacterium]|nr:extracellular solute-binding protein [Actinomycetaceae bacterium]